MIHELAELIKFNDEIKRNNDEVDCIERVMELLKQYHLKPDDFPLLVKKIFMRSNELISVIDGIKTDIE